MDNQQEILDWHIKGLLSYELEPQDINDTRLLSSVEKKFALDMFLLHSGKETPDDPIDVYQPNIFTWGGEADKVFSPIEKHHFIVIAAKGGMGKTAFTFDLARKNANAGNKVMYLSLEMTTDHIATRIAREAAGITKWQWQDRSRITDDQIFKYKAKKKELELIYNLNLVGLGEGSDKSITAIEQLILSEHPDMVVVDNFNLIPKERGYSDTEWDNYLSARFMEFAKEHKIATIVVHHMSKDNTMRGSEKIRDNVSGLFTCFRETEDLENMEEIDRRMFMLTEKKDREFGRPGIFKYYFTDGEFIDSYYKCMDYINNKKT